MTILDVEPAARQTTGSLVRQARLAQLAVQPPGMAVDAERARLLEARGASRRGDDLRRRRDRAVLDSLATLVPMRAIGLAPMVEGVDEPPGTPDADGDVLTLATSPGGVDFVAPLVQRPDAGDFPGDRWWTHSWVDVVPFPVSAEAGRLYVRFTVDLDFQCLTPAADIRGVFSFLSLEAPNYFDVRWPMQIPQFTAVQESVATDLTASIPVAANQQLSLTMTYGVVLFAGNGEFESQGSFATRRTLATGTPTAADYGLIEYRFVPDWWSRAVDRAIEVL